MTGTYEVKRIGDLVPLVLFGEGRGEMQHPLAWALAVVCCVYLLGPSGCATPIKRNPVPVEQRASAKVAGMPTIRVSRGELDADAQAEIVQALRDHPPENYRLNPDGSRSYDVLSLSGGGWNGAFGAGFLNGWTETGNRPNFAIVSGISAGALIAAFAYLGPEYDAKLKEVYMTITGPQDIVRDKGVLAALTGASLTDSEPLARRIEKHVDQALLEAVAQERRRGRFLLVGTTDLDAEELVIWDMGAIADSDYPGALELFRKVLLASSSIPVIMPPVLIEVEVDGKRYDEMHVDGNTMNSAFFHGGVIDLVAAREAVAEEGIHLSGGELYIIQNGRLVGDLDQVEPTLADIAAHSVSTMVRSNRLGDLYRMYTMIQRTEIGFNFVAIPDDDEPVSEEPFDPEEMKRLFELGIRMGRSGTAWRNVPPGIGVPR